jgi:hypothetical protein
MFYLFVKTGLDPEKVADRSKHEIYHERGRANIESKACIEERQLLTINGQERRKEDRIDLEEGGVNSDINVCGRPSDEDSWKQTGHLGAQN